MAFTETTKGIKRAQKGGVIKKSNDGIAALEAEKGDAGADAGAEEVMVQPVLTGTESGLPSLPESIRLLLPAYEETLVKRCKLSKLEGDKKKEIGALMIEHKVKKVSLQNGSHLEWTTEDKIKHVPAAKEKRKKKSKKE